MRLIGFHGKMGCGKSTAISLLSGISDRRVFNIKFAQPLYDLQDMAYERIKAAYARPEDFVKDRKLLQWLGTEWGRSLSPNLWVDIWKAEVKEVDDIYPLSIVVCDDVRFDNEAETIKAMGGMVVEIQSNKADIRINTKAGIHAHPSEQGVRRDLIDHVVRNNGSLVDFESSLRALLDAEQVRVHKAHD